MAIEPTQEAGRPPAASDDSAPTMGTNLANNDLEVDDDVDSVLDSSTGTSSFMTSLKSSIYNYRFENGRRYHAFREGSYPMPNDEDEQERMDLGHHIYSLVLEGKLHLAPIGPNPQRVLDLGTGTGIWAIDFADENPSSEIIGNDLSPIQPEWNPPNCTFEVDDFEDNWLYQVGFDFIHARELEACIADRDRLLQQAFKHLVPKGYFEIQVVDAEFLCDDGTIEKAPNTQLYMKSICEACAKFGKPIDGGTEWKEKMEEAGFIDVHQEIRKVPIGPWPKDARLKEIGKYQVVQQLKAIDSYTPKLFEHALGWTAQEIQVLIAKVKTELQDPSIHLYLPVVIAWGRKP
ncbi:uncharacterized protein FIESC28_08077 [Fusarium coffeatum]|uniref:Methyltransferase domain-containing protein n=1 Tax=Fusarium coffeatum TaxID=231269 RepID=A0A366R977_9HYPO|nr:uncharacterized protein FIESC28_08077 [Fusarium coffeatum]RBR13717.1 hypothetical protein FIESC28_08077 [Fusarium coffeatum]